MIYQLHCFISILFCIIQFSYNSFFSSKYDNFACVSKWILEFPFDSHVCHDDPSDSGCTLIQLNKITVGANSLRIKISNNIDERYTLIKLKYIGTLRNMTRALRSGSLELENGEHEEIDYKTENSSKRYDIIDVGILSGNSIVSSTRHVRFRACASSC